MPAQYDTLIKNVRLARPNHDTIEERDLAVRDGRFAEVAPTIDVSADEVVDAGGLLGFPGVIDAHTHVGIYQPPHEDAPTETASAVSGGVTTMLTYVRTGSLYLNMGGSLKDFFPTLLDQSEGRYYTDYGYHVSPIEGHQVDEMKYLLDQGAPNFGEIFMFYGIHGLHGSSDEQHEWLMLNEGDHYDLAHFDFICREAARLQDEHPDLAPHIAVSFHCETPELLRAYEKKVREEEQRNGLAAYSDARPPHNEAIAISIVGEMAHAAGLDQINILHISSQEALEAGMRIRDAYPDLDVGLETTAGHLLLDHERDPGVWGKVNPPIRTPQDREFLWDHVLDGTLQWIITDHANCPTDMKVNSDAPDDIWTAKAGFAGTEYLLPGIFSEGTSRGLSPNRVAELLAWNPSRRFGLHRKGDVAEGFDADLALLDPDETWTIRAEDSFSSQGYTPFEGLEVTGQVKHTFRRGELVYADGKIVGERSGEYLARPYGTVKEEASLATA